MTDVLPLNYAPDYMRRFIEYIRVSRKKGFSWDPSDPEGQHCISFAMGSVEALTGTNPYVMLASGFQFRDEIGAYRCMKDNFGVTDLGELFDLFFLDRPLAMVQVGDVVVGNWAGQLVSGVAVPPYYYGVLPDLGLQDFGIKNLTKAWDPRTFSVPDKLGHLATNTGITFDKARRARRKD